MDDDQVSLQAHYIQADRLMMLVAWFLFVVALGLADMHGTWELVFTIGLAAALVSTAGYFMLAGKVVTRIGNGIVFMVMTALHIHQGHGIIELHFGVFVLLAFLLFYRDWIPVVAAAAVIAVHHLAFNYLQEWGYPVYVFEMRTGLDMVMTHAVYVVFESVALIYFAGQFKKEAIRSVELQEIAEHLKVVDGRIDLTYRKTGAHSAFAGDFNHFIQTVHEAIGSASHAAANLAASMQHMHAVAAETTGNTRRQQEEIAEIVTAIQQMTASIQEVARNASTAADAATIADEDTQEGADVVRNTGDVINSLADEVNRAAAVIRELDNKTRDIHVILDVIREISEQTNLLALNAAIEAARAGEQGRGFAVVADEVRTLAGRTQRSIQEIGAMIETLQEQSKYAVQAMESGNEQARRGVEQAGKAGEALDRISGRIVTMRGMITQIATAAEEQSAVVEEINRNVVSVNDVAQQTAGGAKNLSDESNTLSSLSIRLTDYVNRFRIE